MLKSDDPEMRKLGLILFNDEYSTGWESMSTSYALTVIADKAYKLGLEDGRKIKESLNIKGS